MSIFSAFTGDAASGRADRTIQYALMQKKEQDAKLAGYNQEGLAALDKGFNQAQTQYADQQQQGLGALAGAYNQGRTDLTGGATRSLAELDPYAQAGSSAQTMLANALGLNGAGGNAAATGAFQAGPGYEWQRDQAIDGAARKFNSLGMAASGNALDAITRLGSELANQSWDGWLDRLTGQTGLGAQVAGQRAGIINGNGQSLASLGQTYGQNQGTLYGKGASDLANLDMQNAIGGAGLWTNLGNQTNSLAASTLNAIAGANRDAGQAQQQGANNLFGLAAGGLNLLSGGLGNMGGLGGLFGGSGLTPGAGGLY